MFPSDPSSDHSFPATSSGPTLSTFLPTPNPVTTIPIATSTSRIQNSNTPAGSLTSHANLQNSPAPTTPPHPSNSMSPSHSVSSPHPDPASLNSLGMVQSLSHNSPAPTVIPHRIHPQNSHSMATR
ncbi:hypothetical protein A2U01_0014842, partial [Trifolium medium]|nr:hypothetical protein [Trifolium medium]